MIQPAQRDRGARVFYRDFRKTDSGVVGEWVDGRINEIGRLLVQVEFGAGLRDINRVELYWAVP